MSVTPDRAAGRVDIARPRQSGSTPARTVLEIGLVNNMPDSAMLAAERQFSGLLAAVAGAAYDIRVRLFHVSEIERGAFAASQMRGRYADVRRIPEAGLDALIVTGAEPRFADLHDEPSWNALAGLVDFAAGARVPSLWSCLAAQIAVLRLDGIVRRRFDQKLTGLFPWMRVSGPTALEKLPPSGVTPHSRHNDIPEGSLIQAGYEIVTHSQQAGVDMFGKRHGGAFLFVQGHPEYEADSLVREFRRDLLRFTSGVEREPPQIPAALFPAAVEVELREAFDGEAAAANKRIADLAAEGLLNVPPTPAWREGARRIFTSWLKLVATEKVERRATYAQQTARPA